MVENLDRVVSDVPGLDTVLCGGLVMGSSYIIQGMPGAGKTVLANQIAFGRARCGEKVLYVTLLAESQDRLFQALSTLTFFDRTKIGVELMYMSLFATLRDEGLSALVAAVRREMSRHKCSMLIMDGLLNARDRGDSTLDVKSFVAEVQGHTAFNNCTVLFLTSARIDESSPEHTMVDGVIQLEGEAAGARTFRQLRISKSRGSAAYSGLHQYEITSDGMSVYPRLEATILPATVLDAPTAVHIGTGVRGLDPLTGGGLLASSMTLLLGASGSGKTTFGINFASMASEAEPALYFGFYETPARLLMKARAVGVDLGHLIEAGALHLIWHPLTENLSDKLAHTLLEAVDRHRIKRLVIDGMSGFDRGAVHRERFPEFFTALLHALRSRGVTTVATDEIRNADNWEHDTGLPALSSMMDNLLVIRQRASDDKMLRLLMPMKLRDCEYDAVPQVIEIRKGGLAVVGPHRQTAQTTATASGSNSDAVF